MQILKQLCEVYLNSGKVGEPIQGNFIYPKSVHTSNDTVFFLVHEDIDKCLVVIGDEKYDEFEGETFDVLDKRAKKCPLSQKNSSVLMKIFDFMKPRSHKDYDFTFGIGDRLGIASPGHIVCAKEKGFFPILAQQSMRELTLTERTYEGVLSDASFAVFQEDLQTGYGADGDHLKTKKEIEYALKCGFTMITLDCSEHIRNEVENFDKATLDKEYAAVSEKIRSHYEKKYLNQTFDIGQSKIVIEEDSLRSIVLTYHEAVEYSDDIFSNVIKACDRDIDFEMSIDETLCPTAPEAHFVVASEMIARGITPVSLAPRFCGEFQKGIDYIGNLEDFEKEFIIHEQIARHFGYKLSIHSGSDKFAVFPIIGKYTDLKVHVKTSGTNWLEAMRVIAQTNPTLYRAIHTYALKNFKTATAYYHVKADLNKVAPLDTIADVDLPNYFNEEDARQLIHITYGLILNEKDASGNYVFKNALYETLYKNEEKYISALQKHIGRHVDMIKAGK